MATKTQTIYTLYMVNKQGASDESRFLYGKAEVRAQIRNWDAKGMTARVIDQDGTLIYEGPALSFK